MLKGIAASAGVSVAKVYKLETPKVVIEKKAGVAEEEVKKFEDALEKTKKDIEGVKERAAKRLSDEELAVFDAHLMMAGDPELAGQIKAMIENDGVNAELIATGLVKNDDIKKFGQIINEEGNRLLNIIDDILKLSKLDEENLEEGRNEINIKNVVESCIQRFNRLTDKKNIKILNKIDDIYIRTHESLFTDLITNIYENAIKYNKVNGQIAIKYIKDRRFIKLIIEDKGIGIKKEDLPRIFERFYVADKQRTRTLKSTGLGLSIVKHICDYLNYDIKVESKYGYGTRFIISIPYN